MCHINMDRLPLTCPQVGTWPATQARALTRSQSGDLLVHRLVLSPLSHTSQGSNGLFIRVGKDIYSPIIKGST